MGVIGLANFIETFYDGYCKSMTDLRRHVSVDHLYFDMNSLLHNAIREQNLILDDVSPLGQYRFIKKVTDKTCETLREVLYQFPPQKSVFLAFDGPVNIAKLQQQQQRRLRQTAGEQCITAGYWLMPLVENEIVNRVSSYLSKQSLRKQGKKGQEIAVEGMRVPGEGEVKIAKHLFAQAMEQKEDWNSSHLIIGNDSDLFLAGMGAFYAHNISYLNLSSMRICCIGSIIRSCLWKSLEMPVVLGIESKRQFKHGSLGGPAQSNTDSASIFEKMTCIRLDFIFLFLLSGNDYIPQVNGYNARNVWAFYQQFLNKMAEKNMDLFENMNEGNGLVNSLFLTISKKNSSKLDKNKRARIQIGFRRENLITFFRLAFQLSAKTKSQSFTQERYGHVRPWVHEYLRAVSWCIETIITGTCPDNHFIPTKYVPTVDEILDCVSAEDFGRQCHHFTRLTRRPTFLPVVHFHLAVQSPKLLNQAVFLAIQQEQEMNTNLSSSTQTCPDEKLEAKGYIKLPRKNAHGAVAEVLNKGNRTLTILTKEFPIDDAGNKCIEKMNLSTLQERYVQEYLEIMQFRFDEKKTWSVRRVVQETTKDSLPTPNNPLKQNLFQDDRPSSHVMRFTSIVSTLPPHSSGFHPSSLMRAIGVFDDASPARKSKKVAKRRLSGINMEITV